MATNQTNGIENLKQWVTNWITAMLQVLETSGDVTNIFGFRDSLAEDREAQRILCVQVLQILEENGLETEALVNAFNTARNQSSSDTEVQEALENLRLQIGEILSNARIQELAEELRIYYERILNHESLRYVFQEAHEHALLLIQPSRQSDPRFMAEVKEKLKEFLRKFLEVEIALNDQQCWRFGCNHD